MKPITNWINFHTIEPSRLLVSASQRQNSYEEECMRFHDLIAMSKKNLMVRKCMNDLIDRVAVFPLTIDGMIYN